MGEGERKAGDKISMTKKKPGPKHPKSYLTNLANMKLLVSDPEFQAIVSEIRGQLNIPENGIKTDIEMQKWLEKHLDDGDQVMENEEYQSRGRIIFDDYEAGRIDHGEYCTRINRHDEEIPLNYKAARIKFIIEKFGLPENYCSHIENYIVSGQITAPTSNFVLGPFKIPKFRKNHDEIRHITVTFYTIPTDEDLRLAKKFVEQMATRRGMRIYRELSHIDRDLDIEQWYREKERFDAVENASYRTTAAEIAEEKLGDRSKSGQVRAIVRDLGKTRKKRFRTREKT
ncbi:MAG: hypothetical protein ABIJ46_01760 [bacterium]